MVETKLLPCPHCGGEAKIIEHRFRCADSLWTVRCKGCACESGAFDTEAEAIEAWNKRVPPTEEQIVAYIEKTHKENNDRLKKLKRMFKTECLCHECVFWSAEDGCMEALCNK